MTSIECEISFSKRICSCILCQFFIVQVCSDDLFVEIFQGSEIDKRASVASTNQAASAESLQHQTPSLENLLARSRIYDDRIPEVVFDDMPPLEDQRTHGKNTLFVSKKFF